MTLYGTRTNAVEAEEWNPSYRPTSNSSQGLSSFQFLVDTLDSPKFLFPSAPPRFESGNNVIRLESYRERPSQQTDALPPAIQANWFEWQASQLSPEARGRLTLFAGERTGWLGEQSIPLEAGPLRDFLELWRLISPEASEPEFALSTRGWLQVEWHKDWKRHLELLFLGTHRVRYLALLGRDTHQGECSLADMPKILAAFPRNTLRI